MSDQANVSISSDIKVLVDKYAEKRELKTGEALDKLLSTAFGRLAALNKYGKALKKAAVPKTKVKQGPKPKKVAVVRLKAPRKKAAKKQLAPSVQAKIEAAAAE